MSSSAGSKVKSCADCYFRQELVCALRTDTVCPTFRPVQGKPASQARLVAVPEAAVRSVEQAPAAAASVETPAPRPLTRVAASARPARQSVTVDHKGTMPMDLDAAMAPRRDRVAARVAQRFPGLPTQ